MTRNRSDTAPDNLGRKDLGRKSAARDAGEEVGDAPATAEQVAAYLRQHPDFFDHNPELLDAIAPAGAARAEGVVDLRHFMVERLRDELAGMSALRDQLVVTGRTNLSAQARVHKAILALLAARSFEHFVETLTTDLAVSRWPGSWWRPGCSCATLMASGAAIRMSGMARVRMPLW